MSEEEKKALKEVKHFNRLTRYWQQEEYEEKEIEKYISTLLNLIENQQKEIEKLTKKYKNAKEMYIVKDNSLTDYIHKDKIRDKIKELEKDMVLTETRAILKELLEE